MYGQSYYDLITQGELQATRGDLQRAALYFEEAVVLARAEGDDYSEMDALDRLSSNYYNLGNNEKSIEVNTRLLARARQVHSEKFQMIAAFNLAIDLGRLDLRGRWQEIKPLLLEGLYIARALSDQYEEIRHLVRLGYYAARMHEDEPGFAWLQEALGLIRPETDSSLYLFGTVYAVLSEVVRRRGMLVEAIRYAEMAVDSFRKYGRAYLIAEAQVFLAIAEREQGEKAEALHLIEQVLLEARRKGWKHQEQWTEYLRGELERELGHLPEAEAAARQALKLAQEMKEKEQEVECLLSLGQVLLARRCHEEAHEILKQARRLSQERDYEDHFKKAETLFGGEV